MAIKIELIHVRHCPNVEPARRNLQAALRELGQPLEWTEWEQADPSAPSHARQCASPTILIDGQDVAGESDVAGNGGCRVYRDKAGHYSGVPARQTIVRTLGLTLHRGSRGY